MMERARSDPSLIILKSVNLIMFIWKLTLVRLRHKNL